MSEKMGRCRSEVDDCYGGLPLVAIADAIDRLAEDVAAIKAAILPQTTEERDAAIRERDEARALLGLAQVQRTAAYADRDEPRAEVYQLKCSRTETSKDRDAAICQRDAARAEVEKLKESRDAADRLYGATLDEVERLKNELYYREQEILSLRADTVERYEPIAAPQPAEVSDAQPAAPDAGWLTQEERRILSAHVQALRDQRRAMERGGQTLGYIANPCGFKREADAIDAILARAGSPPVVEVPAMPLEVGDANTHAGQYLRGRRDIAVSYRAALDKAGVARKAVPRE